MKRLLMSVFAVLILGSSATGQDESGIREKIDWMSNYMEFEVVSPRDSVANDAQAYVTAIVHGQVLAYAQLQLRIGEFALMSEITGDQKRVKDYVQVGTSASDINYPGLTLKNIHEERLRDGSRQYVLVYETPLAGKGSMLNLALDEIREEAAQNPIDPFPEPEDESVAESQPEVIYSGLVIDLRGKQVSPTPVVRILSESRQEVYGILKVPASYVQQHGLVGYARTVDQPASIRERIGNQPLVIESKDVVEVIGGNPILTDEASERIVAADQKGQFLSKSRVAFLIGQ